MYKKIFINHNPLIANYSSHIWVLHSMPFVYLQWDPSYYGWKLSMYDTSPTKVLPFLTYSMAFGRNFLLNQIESVLAGKTYWEEGNVSSSHMVMFWKQFWSIKCMNKVLYFQWLMIHYALLVGDFVVGSMLHQSCIMFGSTLRPCIMYFGIVLQLKVFGSFRILMLIGHKYRSLIFTWGVVFWGILDQQMTFYHSHDSSLTLQMRSF